MSFHGIPNDVKNSDVEFCISEYVRLERDQNILRDHWFRGASMMKLAEDYDLSLTAIKNIIYKIGDPILLRACDHSAQDKE